MLAHALKFTTILVMQYSSGTSSCLINEFHVGIIPDVKCSALKMESKKGFVLLMTSRIRWNVRTTFHIALYNSKPPSCSAAHSERIRASQFPAADWLPQSSRVKSIISRDETCQALCGIGAFPVLVETWDWLRVAICSRTWIKYRVAFVIVFNWQPRNPPN